MACGVARQVVGPHAHAAAQVPDRAIAVAGGVGPGLVMEILLHDGVHRVQHILRVAIVLAHAVPRLGSGQVGLMHLHRGVHQAVQPGHVVFVNMAQDDQVHRVQLGPDAVGHLGCVKGHPHVGPLHDELVAVRVLAGLFTQMHAHRAKTQNRGHNSLSKILVCRQQYSQRDTSGLAHTLQLNA